MKIQGVKYLLLLPLLWLAFACAKEEHVETGGGRLLLTVELEPLSRAETPGDGNSYDGGGMEDLSLVLVNPNGVVAAISRLTGITGDEQRIKQVSFEHLDVGNYTVYAYANTLRSYLTEGEALLASLAVGSNFGAAQRDALFATRTGSDAPEMSTTEPLLLTASQEVAIEMGTTVAEIVLVRPVVRFAVELHNNSSYPMTVADVTTGAFNPSTGYLLPHGGVIPASVVYRSLPSYDHFTGGTDLVVAAQSEAVIYRTELFENRATDYTLGFQLQVTAPKTSYATTTVTSLETGTQYALRNRSTGRYLIDNGGTMTAVASLEEAPSLESALWTFSGTSSGYLTNVATGNRYYRSHQTATSGSNLTFTKSGNYFRVTYTTGSGRWQTTYYLHDRNNAISYDTSSYNTCDWQVQRVTEHIDNALITKTVEDSPIQVVNPTTGVVEVMREQLRNQSITVTVNAYYNEQAGSFRFEVLPWEEKHAEVEFN